MCVFLCMHFPPPCIHECVRASQPVCSWLCLTRETTEYQPACPGVYVGVARRFEREEDGQPWILLGRTVPLGLWAGGEDGEEGVCREEEEGNKGRGEVQG